jgi:hypothetical protein
MKTRRRAWWEMLTASETAVLGVERAWFVLVNINFAKGAFGCLQFQHEPLIKAVPLPGVWWMGTQTTG